MHKTIDYPREVAVKILYEINHKKAYINIAINEFLRDKKLSDKDRAFVHQLVYGVSKNMYYIDWIIKKYSNIKFKKISPWIKEILRIGIFQLFLLDRVPTFAAIDESVEMSKKYSKGKSDKFTNAILRNALRDKDNILSHKFNKIEALTIKYSTPQWLTDYLLRQYSYEKVEDFYKKSLEIAPTTIRVNKMKCTIDQLKCRFDEEGIEYVQGHLFNDALTITNFSDITSYLSYQDGLFLIQDEAAMLTVEILNPQPGDSVLDMCSAPGGKTTHIGEKLLGQAGLISRDIYDHKISLIKSNCKRLGLVNIKIELKDGLELYNDEKNKYDRVLLDAPCSGLGIIRRKPDIKYKLKSEDIPNIIKLQKILIDNAYAYLKINGILVYSTCTINKKENEEVIKYLLDKNADAKVVLPPTEFNHLTYKKQYIQTFPDTNKYDGFFICKIQKNS